MNGQGRLFPEPDDEGFDPGPSATGAADGVVGDVPTDGYSSSISGSRPEEEAYIESLLASAPPAPDVEFTEYYDPDVDGLVRSEPADGPPITEPWAGLARAADPAPERSGARPPRPAPQPTGSGSPPPPPDPPEPPTASDFPDPPDDAVYQGLLGLIAKAVAPHTEADPVAILATLMTILGVVVGRAQHFYQGSHQRPNLMVLLVGDTATGRKGTSLSVARDIFRDAVPTLDALTVVGVASGEAITAHLKRNEHEPRMFLLEPEFGRLLTAMNRDGSTLSATLRNAWDGVPLGYAKADGGATIGDHHVGMLGHITPVELRAKLTSVDAANGFSNRLLFVACRRQRSLPFPEDPRPHVQWATGALHQAMDLARRPRELRFDEVARERWAAFYAEEDRTTRYGLAGALTARHLNHVARLALVYAVAESSESITAEHLEAAIALADYSRRSVRWAFGDSTGNRHADELRRMLRDEPEGIAWDLARRELGLRNGADMSEVVDVLRDARLAVVVTEPRKGGGGGRPKRFIRLTAPFAPFGGGQMERTSQTSGWGAARNEGRT